jgi:hypothetical protein
MIVKNQKAGVIDSLNNFIIPMIYTWLWPLNEDIPLEENKYLNARIGKKEDYSILPAKSSFQLNTKVLKR